MTEIEAFEIVADALAEQVGFERDEITPATRLVDDLGVDSIDAAQVAAALEERTGTLLRLDARKGIAGLERVEDLVRAFVRSASALPTGEAPATG